MRARLENENLVYVCAESLELFGLSAEPVAFRFHGISYSDDVAYPIVSRSAAEIVAIVKRTAEIVAEIAMKMGLRINFGVGKTEVTIAFRGAGAKRYRKKMECENCIQLNGPDGSRMELHWIDQTKHIGSRFSVNSNPMQDLVMKSRNISLAEVRHVSWVLRHESVARKRGRGFSI